MKVGVTGAGTVGSGIAQVSAAIEGYEVILCDTQEDSAENGKKKIQANSEKLVSKGKMEKSKKDAILSKITIGLKEKIAGCDLVMEAAIENMQVKRELFLTLQGIYREETILSTNTPSLSVTELSPGSDRPAIGMHFFNPAPIMKLTGTAAGLNTLQDLVDCIPETAKEIGKTPAIAKNAAGLIVNRILVLMISEAVGIYANGTASVEDIDTATQLGVNHPAGPLALGDLAGLDIYPAIMEALQSKTGDTKYRPYPLLYKIVRGDVLGRKTGKGFYIH